MKVIKLILQNKIPRVESGSITMKDSSMVLNIIADHLSFYYSKDVISVTVGEIKYKSITFIVNGYKEPITLEAVDNSDVMINAINRFLEDDDDAMELVLLFTPTNNDVLIKNDETKRETKIPVCHGWLNNLIRKGDEDTNEADI